MRRKTRFLSLMSAALATVAFAQTNMDHSTMNMDTKAQSSTSSMDMSGMQTDMSSLEKLSGKAFDRAFLSMMIPHHQAAVDMSKVVLPSAKDPSVKKWANQIIADQNREIAQITTWLKTLGGPNAKMQAMMKNTMSGMVNGVKSARNPQRTFVQDMVGHHASAIEMASLALQKSSDDRVLKIARDIVRAQASEMYNFRQWLKS